MRLELSPDSRVFIDLRATGLLRAVAHDPTLSVRPQPATLDVGEGDGEVALRFQVRDIEPPASLSDGDRRKMLDNLRGPDVLDAVRFPNIELRARYAGTLEGGELRGQLVVRGQPRAIAMPVSAVRQWDVVVATGAWEGALLDLGIKPFKALLGALKLEDWVRLRVEARLRTPSTP